MGKDNRTRIQVPIRTAMMSFFIFYPSTKFLAILKTEKLGRKAGSVSLKRDDLLWSER
jgi:hypothetical protein